MQDLDKIFSFLKKIDTLSFEEVDLKIDDLKIHTKKSNSELVIKNENVNQDLCASEDKDDEQFFIFRSPLIGTIYLTPGPDDPPYIQVGDEVKIGQTICLIEAMKIFNEIKSDVSGVVTKILVENENSVDYNQAILVIKKF